MNERESTDVRDNDIKRFRWLGILAGVAVGFAVGAPLWVLAAGNPTWPAAFSPGSPIVASEVNDYLNDLHDAANGSTSTANFYVKPGNSDQAIQDAVNAASANGGGTVRLLAGTHNMNGEVTLRSNVHLVGAGRGATILRRSSSNVAISDNAGVVTDASIRDLTFDAGTVISQHFCTLTSTGTARVALDGLGFVNGVPGGSAAFVVIRNARSISMTRCHAQSVALDHVFLAIGTLQTFDIVVADNIFDGSSTAAISFNYDLTGGLTAGVVIANNVIRPNGGGVEILSRGVAELSGWTIVGNVIRDMVNGNIGIRAVSQPSSDAIGRGVISGNMVHGTGSTFTTIGIQVNKARGVSVNANSCHVPGNGVGIQMDNTNTACIAIGNNCVNSGSSSVYGAGVTAANNLN